MESRLILSIMLINRFSFVNYNYVLKLLIEFQIKFFFASINKVYEITRNENAVLFDIQYGE